MLIMPQSQLRWMLYSYYFDITFAVEHETWSHTMHCLDVLRQKLVCAADDTLMARSGDAAPGEGAIRECKNFEALKSWASRHSAA